MIVKFVFECKYSDFRWGKVFSQRRDAETQKSANNTLRLCVSAFKKLGRRDDFVRRALPTYSWAGHGRSCLAKVALLNVEVCNVDV